MKKLSFILLLFAVFQTAMAKPAKPVWRTVSQSDGTTLRVMLCGDEFFHYYKTTDNVALVEGEDGNLYYADAFGFGMKSTGVLAHEALLRTERELSVMRSVETIEEVKPYAPRRISPLTDVGDDMDYVGEKRGLIILVEFANLSFKFQPAKDIWNDIANKEGYDENGAYGSVYDYFKAQSNGVFSVKFDVIGPVTVSQNYSYYGRNNDAKAPEMIYEAVQLVADSVDFADYDWDGDGEVENFYVVYAGKGEADGGGANTIWPHQYALDYAGFSNTYVDDVKVNTYACGNEVTSSNKIDGIGTICHEFSHCLGFPDMYNTSSGSSTIGYWDVMDTGCYAGNGWVPPCYSSFERFTAGWIEPLSFADAYGQVEGMEPMPEGGDVYWIVNDNNSNEYYLLENRQKTGWDKYLPSDGLVVWHIDYLASAWRNNTPNNSSSHLRVAPVAADNKALTRTSSRAAYPYQSNDSLTDNSKPAATWFKANKSGVRKVGFPITQIKNEDGLVSFVYGKEDNGDPENPDNPDDPNNPDEPDTPDDPDTPDAIISLSATQRAVVYDMNGRRLTSVSSMQGLNSLPHGVYILKFSDGQTQKVSR